MATAHWTQPARSNYMFDAKSGRSSSLSESGYGRELGAGAKAVLFSCAIIAFLVSGYLAWVSYTASPIAGCGAGSVFDCENVLQSRWSKIGPLPVSIPALFTHGAVVVLLAIPSHVGRLARIKWHAVAFAALVAGAAGLWFMGLQLIVLRHVCPYCLAAHICGVIMAATILWKKPISRSSLRYVGSAAIVSLGVFIAIQSSNEAPLTYEVITHEVEVSTNASETADEFSAPEPMIFEAPQASLPIGDLRVVDKFFELRQMVALALQPSHLILGQVGASGSINQSEAANNQSEAAKNGRPVRVLNNLTLNSSDWPMIGNASAEMILVELFDYTCPHCQSTHNAIEQARGRYGDRLAVIALPVPLDRQCNPTVQSTNPKHAEACDLAKLAISVWLVDRSQFETFHDYLFTEKPSFQAANQRASQIIDDQALQKTMGSATPNEYIAKHVSLYQKAGSGTIPKLMFPSTTIAGAVNSGDSIAHLIEQHLGN